MATKNSRFDLDWWVVQKRLIYIVISVVVIVLLAGGVGLYLWKYGNPFANPKTTADMPAGARFASFEGDVRVIRSATRETLSASLQTQLYPGDTIQTQSDGRARISLVDGSTLVIRPNSTVIIRDNTSSESGQKNVRVKVDTGQINVRTENQPEGTNNVVETSQSQSTLASETASSFNVNPDKTAEIRVQTGQIETTTSNGDKTIIRGNEYVALSPAGTFGQRERLLEIPLPSGPRNLEKVSGGKSGAANVPLRWQRPPSGTAAHYRVEVASSPFFVPAGKVIERDQLASNEFNASDLRPGDYFWRVRATARSGQVSDWSEAQKFTVVSQGTGERFSFSDIVVEHVGAQIYVIRGRTQPGTTVSSLGREILSDSSGVFRLQVTAPQGAGEVVLEAQDQQGNRTEHRVRLQGGGSKPRK